MKETWWVLSGILCITIVWIPFHFTFRTLSLLKEIRTNTQNNFQKAENFVKKTGEEKTGVQIWKD